MGQQTEGAPHLVLHLSTGLLHQRVLRLALIPDELLGDTNQLLEDVLFRRAEGRLVRYLEEISCRIGSFAVDSPDSEGQLTQPLQNALHVFRQDEGRQVNEGREAQSGARVRLKSMSKPPNLAEIEEQIERLSIEKDESVKAADYERAAELRDQAENLRCKKEEIQKEWKAKVKETEGLVDEEVIAEVVSKMTGVPLTRLEKAESDRLLKLEGELHKTIVSQDEPKY